MAKGAEISKILAGMLLWGLPMQAATANPKFLKETPRMGPELVLEPNRGQTDAAVRWVGRASGYQVFVTNQQLVLKLLEGKGKPSSVLRFRFGKQNFQSFEPARQTRGESNYFRGNNKSHWVTKVPHYRNLSIAEVSPGIGLSLYGNAGQLEYDLILKPGASRQGLLVEIDGAQSLDIDPIGDLRITTQTGAILKQRKPLVYQVVSGVRKVIGARYVKWGQNSAQIIVDGYDKSLPLVVDPVLVYSTYLGGSRMEVGNNDATFPGLAVDGAGSAYVSGSSYSIDYPTTGAIQVDPGDNDLDAVITKMSPDGSQIVYSTYLGGRGNDTGGNIAVDSTGAAYVTGFTFASDFPTVNPIHGDRGHREAFVTKISPDGSSLVYSTYLGGNSDDRGSGIAVDSLGNAYVSGHTYSNDFPVLNAYQSNLASLNADVFVAKINANGTLGYSTYLGGSAGDDFGYGIAVDSAGAAYVVGAASTNFPVVNPIQGVAQPGANALIAKIHPNGNQLLFSTFYGGSGDDLAFDAKIDAQGNLLVGGVTVSSDFPLVNSPQSFGGSADAFVLKINQTTNTVVYSAVFGGTGNEDTYSLAVDTAGNTYFGGATSSTNLPLVNQLYGDQFGEDGFVAMIGPNGGSILFSSYFGGGGSDYFSFFGSDRVQKVALDPAGNLYAMGTTTSDSTFPLLNAVDTVNQQGELFVAKFTTQTVPGLTASPSSAMIPAAAGSGTFTVSTTLPSIPWTATSSSPWVTVTAPLGLATGNGTVSYSFADNPGPGQRAASISVSGAVFSIVQASPVYTVSPLAIPSAPVAGGSVSVQVATSAASAAWSATSRAAWISVASPLGSSAGPGTVTLSLSPNPFPAKRTGSVLIAGTVVTVTQAGTQGDGGIVTTIAGRRSPIPYSGDGGPAVDATLSPMGLALDPSGNLIIVTGEKRIRRINTSGIISTIAGTGERGNGGDGGPATSAQVSGRFHVSSDSAGNLLFGDVDNGRIRRISNTGTISRVAGTVPWGFGGDGGQATDATLYFPHGATLGPDGNVYIADYGNHRIRRVNAAGVISTYAGTGTCGFSGDGGQAANAQLCYPHQIAFDASGNLLFVDTVNQRIRRITPAGVISTVVGNGVEGFGGDGGPATQASLYRPTGFHIDSQGQIYIADTQNYRIRLVNTAGIIGTIAGTGAIESGADNIPAVDSAINLPVAVVVDGAGNVIFSEGNGQRVRKITFGPQRPTPTINLNLTSVTYNGAQQPVTGTVTGSSNENLGAPTITYNGSATPPTNAGTYSINATFAGNLSYGPATLTGSYTILKAVAQISWPNPDPIPTGSPLTNAHLNATARFLGSPLAGVFSYTPGVGTILPVGSHILSANFVPSDTANFQSTSATQTVNVLACTYGFTPVNATVGGSAGSGSFSVNTQAGCGVSPTTVAPWVTLGVSANVVTYTYSANNTGASRSANIAVGGSTFALTQTSNQVSLTFQTNPPGLAYSVNGVPYSTSQTIALPVGGAVSLAAVTPQQISPGTRNVFASWSQGGPAVQSLVVPASNTTYTIQYNTEHQLITAVSPAGSGSLVGGNYYLAGSTASLTPIANLGYAFLNYAGDLTGTAIPGSVVMNGPKSVTANFAGIPSLTIARTAATGLPTSRIWTLTVTNSAPVGAANAHIASLALTQTAGATCTSPPVVSPLAGSPNLGSLTAGGSAALPVTINFSTCPAA
ncbi:MAG: SBBP repeat-containing protein, partial [Acidobacteriaceae bacterium]|nr:SBBP repeat-containing protein [Acidobacteriaceae bacterium]